MSRRSRHRDGQASVEDAVVVAFIAIIASAAIGYLRSQTNTLFIAQGQTLGTPTLRVGRPLAYVPPATTAATATATPTPIPTATSSVARRRGCSESVTCAHLNAPLPSPR